MLCYAKLFYIYYQAALLLGCIAALASDSDLLLQVCGVGLSLCLSVCLLVTTHSRPNRESSESSQLLEYFESASVCHWQNDAEGHMLSLG